MELFGYEEGSKQQTPIKLSEASLLTSPSELRAIAKALAELAEEMGGDGFEHAHLKDRLPNLVNGPELIVVKARQVSEIETL